MTIALAFAAVALLGGQDVRTPSTTYHSKPDVRRHPSAAQLAPRLSREDSSRPPTQPSAAPRHPASRAQAAASGARLQGDRTLQFDVDGDGRHWARGRDYKASFDAAGASFIPFLGSQAPRNFPITFALAGARQGGEAAQLPTPSVTRSGERIVLDQGSIRTEYVVGLGGLEQLFVLDAPLGSGDLVLDVALAHSFEVIADGAGWRFENALGAVSYGAAFVLDAAGRKLDLETRLIDGAFRFTVPSHFLVEASWPIAVDPLIANVTIDTDVIDQLEVDVAFDPTTGRYLVAFEEVFSATDHDIQSWLVDGAGNVVAGSARFIDFTTTYRSAPRIAMTNVRRNFLCAYVEGAGLSRRIGARARHADTSAIGTAFLVDESTAFDRFEPDICGDSYSGAASVAHYTIVWRRRWGATDSDIVARVVDEDGTFVTSELFVTNIIGVSDEAPSISKCIPTGMNDSVVVWRRGQEIFASMISYHGVTVRTEFLLATAFQAISRPQVSGLSNSQLLGSTATTFVACWDEDFTTDRDVRAVVAAAQNNNAVVPVVSSSHNLSFMEHIDYLLDQRDPDVACMGDRWVITQSAVYPGSSDYVTRATTVNIVGAGLGISERFAPLTLTFDETLTPRIASRHEAGDTGNLEALTGWIQQVNFGLQGDVYGAVHAASAANTCAQQVCYGNPNGFFNDQCAFIWVEGDFSTTGTKRLHALDLYPNAFGYFLASLTTQGGSVPPNSAGVLCLAGSIGRYSNFVLNSGPGASFFLDINPAAISQPTGAVPAMSGQTWYFQAWHRDVPFGGGAPTSNFTNAAGIPFQ